MKFKYRDQKFQPESLLLIKQCNDIIAGYTAQGLTLTLRQLYYQLVTRNLVPNTEKSYKRVGGLISDGRLAGHIDWDAIEDRVRQPKVQSEWRSVSALVDTALRAYRLPRWKGQDHYVELWVEKDALAGVLEPIASRFHVTLMVNRGYSSQSAMKDSADRFIAAAEEGQDGILFYLGDHDPSGEDMVRDIRDRLTMFCEAHGQEAPRVEKLALTMAQVEEYDPPPNPAKMTDSRAAKYVEEHGESSWEVDALDPKVLNGIIASAITGVLDEGKMAGVITREEEDKRRLHNLVQKNWRD